MQPNEYEALARAARRSSAAAPVLGWLWGGIVVLVGLEATLYLLAIVLFSHIDTQECAATNTFCSPDGRPGLTGGGALFLVGNFLVLVLAMVIPRIARQSSSRSAPQPSKD